MPLRDRIIRFLKDRDYAGLLDASRKEHGVLRVLISLTYDKADVISWRAIEAVGLVAGRMGRENLPAVRNLAQRLLWMLREESGNNPWGVPEMLGEIVRNCPQELADLPPIIASFHDEDILRQGVLRALWRISEVIPDSGGQASLLAACYVSHSDPVCRAYAVLLAARLDAKDCLAGIRGLAGDESEVTVYEEGELRLTTVGKIAAKTGILTGAPGNEVRS